MTKTPEDEKKIAEAEAELLNATSGLDRLMKLAFDLKNQTFSARQGVADAYKAWISVAPRAQTLDELKREHVAHEQAERAGRADGTVAPAKVERRVYLNPIDYANGGAKGGSADDFVRAQIKTGARRGAFGSAQRGGQLVNVHDERGQVIGRKLQMPV